MSSIFKFRIEKAVCENHLKVKMNPKWQKQNEHTFNNLWAGTLQSLQKFETSTAIWRQVARFSFGIEVAG